MITLWRSVRDQGLFTSAVRAARNQLQGITYVSDGRAEAVFCFTDMKVAVSVSRSSWRETNGGRGSHVQSYSRMIDMVNKEC